MSENYKKDIKAALAALDQGARLLNNASNYLKDFPELVKTLDNIDNEIAKVESKLFYIEYK